MMSLTIACGKATESHAPGQFLRNDGAQRFIAAFDARRSDVQNSISGDARKIASVHSVKGGKNQGTYAAERANAARKSCSVHPGQRPLFDLGGI